MYFFLGNLQKGSSGGKPTTRSCAHECYLIVKRFEYVIHEKIVHLITELEPCTCTCFGKAAEVKKIAKDNQFKMLINHTARLSSLLNCPENNETQVSIILVIEDNSLTRISDEQQRRVKIQQLQMEN